MMTFHILTIFPNIFDSFLKEGLLKKAQDKGILKIKIWNLRDFAKDKRKTVDDKPFGGGPGMVLKVEPIYFAVKKIKSEMRNSSKVLTLLLSLRGEKFSQKMAHEFLKYENIILICGRYEGVDERVAKYIADKEISIGDYILSGGEVPAMVIIEVVSRLLPGFLGNENSLEEKRELFSYPVYTRPRVFEPEPKIKWKVPEVLLSGDHQKIKEWRKKHSKKILF